MDNIQAIINSSLKHSIIFQDFNTGECIIVETGLTEKDAWAMASDKIKNVGDENGRCIICHDNEVKSIISNLQERSRNMKDFFERRNING